MPLPTRSVLLACLGLALTLAACTAPVAPDETAPDGLFDDSPLLPALSTADAGAWRWIPTPGMQCRDGSDTGFGLRRAAGSRDLLVLLQGGGACFDFLSCLLNPGSYDEADFNAEIAAIGERGAFSTTEPANPFLRWNVVYVPYCTGDVHAGNAPDTPVPGVGRQDFVGYRNLETALERFGGDRVRQARQVVLSGVSAGGFGTVGTYALFAERLAPAPVDLLDDSGPIVRANDVLDPGLQQRWRDLWNLDEALPPGCPDALCSQPNGDGLEFVLPYYARTHPDRTFGVLSYTRDAVIRGFFGLGDPDCGPDPSACTVGAEAYEDALFGLRTIFPPNVGTYYVAGDGHTFLLSDTFYSTTVEGVPLTRWVRGLINGQTGDLPTALPLMLADAE